jgi:site-specific DNA-adenine methylase
MFKPLKNKNYDENEKQILINSLFTNNDYINIFNQYKDDDKAFLFIDPPYLFSDNSGYFPQNEKKDMTAIILDILELLKSGKCKVMLIINKLNILEYLFKDFIKGEYSKIYAITKKGMKHLIITNY